MNLNWKFEYEITDMFLESCGNMGMDVVVNKINKKKSIISEYKITKS